MMEFTTKTILNITLVVIAIGVVALCLFNATKSSLLSAQSSSTTKCVVTLFGKEYDVTTYRNMHKGGNVFICGTDMTTAYQQQHGSDTRLLQRELKSN